jgi:hypothetical protein
MKIQTIIGNRKNLRTFFDLDIVNQVLHELFGYALGAENEEDIDLFEFDTEHVYSLHEVYALKTGAGEDCQLVLVCVDDEPLALWTKRGIGTEVTPLDRETGLSIAEHLSQALARYRMERLRQWYAQRQPPENLADVGTGLFWDLSDTTFGVLGDADMQDAPFLRGAWSAWVADGQNLNRVCGIECGKAKRSRVLRVMVEGEIEPREATPGNIIFQIGLDEKDREIVEEQVNAPTDWFIAEDESDEVRRELTVYVRSAGAWNYEGRLIAFRSQTGYRAFLDRYSFDTPVHGDFPVDEAEALSKVE